MIAFGVAVTQESLFARVASPGISRTREPDSVVITRHNQPLAVAYNGILDEASHLLDLEALVLVHQDAELLDPHLAEKLRARLIDPSIALIGTVGVRGVRSGLMWTRGSENLGLYRGELFGVERCFSSPHVGPHEVDAVDGFLMILAPWAVKTLRFDEELAANFHCYDTDYCFQARSRGRKVVVEPIDVVHRWTPRLPDATFRGALQAFHRKWGLTIPEGSMIVPQRWGVHEYPEEMQNEPPIETGWTSHAAQLALVGRGKRVLELGCHVGRMSARLDQNGCTVVGLELDAAAGAQAQAYCERVINVDLDAVDVGQLLNGDEFDVILAGDVLEHLKNPGQLLAQLRQHLRKEGYLVASVPNVGHGTVRLALYQGRWDPQPSGLLDGTHLRFFTRTSANAMFEDAGYEVAHLERITAPLIPRPGMSGQDGQPDPRPHVDWDSVPTGMLADLYRDPEAQDFQYVFAAYPREGPLPPTLQAALVELRQRRLTQAR